MSASLSRKYLFGGAWNGRGDPIRPPWSFPDARFTDNCTICGDCIAACPQSILVKGRAGYPVVDFSHGACDFCGACREACREPAFFERERSPWEIAPRFGDECLSSRGVTCRVCSEWCDARAIRFRMEVGGGARPDLAISDCTGCGACIPACPVQAIQMENPQ